MNIAPIAGLIISIVALVISAWTRFESFTSLKRQRRIDLAKRVSAALVSAQEVKNELYECMDATKALIANHSISLDITEKLAHEQQLARMADDYQVIWDMLKAFEHAAIAIAKGGKLDLDEAAIEARIGRFQQTRILAQYDSKSIIQILERHASTKARDS